VATTTLPETGYVRLPHIIGQSEVTEEEAERNRRDAEAAKASGKKPNRKPKRARKAIPAIVPVKKSAWWEGVASGRFPKPTKCLGPRVAAWRVEAIRELVERGVQ